MAEATARELGRISLEEALGSGYSAQDAVHDLDPDDVAVVDPVNVVHAAPGENATKWAAMRDDEYVLVRMRLGESPEGRQHPLSHLLRVSASPQGAPSRACGKRAKISSSVRPSHVPK
jgi:hypothetical protein